MFAGKTPSGWVFLLSKIIDESAEVSAFDAADMAEINSNETSAEDQDADNESNETSTSIQVVDEQSESNPQTFQSSFDSKLEVLEEKGE